MYFSPENSPSSHAQEEGTKGVGRPSNWMIFLPVMAYTDSAGLDRNKAPKQFLTVLFHQLYNIADNLPLS